MEQRTVVDNVRAYSFFLVVAAVAYLQIFLLRDSVKWDLLDCYLPWRYHVGECIQNGIFPLWNPYTNAGYPIFADLRSVWYPETLMVGLTTGYSNITLHLLFITYISFAGFGMFLLSGHFTNNNKASLLVGAAYSMSGFFIGHAQEMFGIIAATWIPYVIHYYISIQKHGRLRDVFKAVIFLFLLITGGYQAMWVIMLYLLLVIFIYYLWISFKNRSEISIRKLLSLNLLLVLLSALSITVVIVSYFQGAPFVNRLTGLSIEDAYFMPFSPQSTISFLLPFTTVKDLVFFDTDVSMNNAYVGVVILCFAISGLFQKRDKLLIVFLVFGFIALLASFGRYTPVRGVLYHALPLLDMFRHSSFFVYFAMLGLFVSAASGLGKFMENPQDIKKQVLVISIVISSIITTLAGYSLINEGIISKAFFTSLRDSDYWMEISTWKDNLQFQAIIQVLVLLILIILIVKQAKFRWLAILVLAEMWFAVQLNTNYTVVFNNTDPVFISRHLNRQPKGFPVPGNRVIENDEKVAAVNPLWRNTSIFNKSVSFQGFNSFRLADYDLLNDSFPELAKVITDNKVIYLSDNIVLFSHYDPSLIDKKIIFVDNSIVALNNKCVTSPGDTVTLNQFSPGSVHARVTSQKAVVMTLLQSAFPGWKVKIDDKDVPYFKSNKLFISFISPPGTHEVEYSYSNPLIVTAFFVSYFTIFIVLLLIIVYSFKGGLRVIVMIAYFALIIVVVVITQGKFNKPYHKSKNIAYIKAVKEIVKQEPTRLICNTDRPTYIKDLLQKQGYKGEFLSINLSLKSDISSTLEFIEQNSNGLSMLNLFTPLIPEVEALLMVNKESSKRLIFKSGSLITYSHKESELLIHEFNDFERIYAGWVGNQSFLDSTVSSSGSLSNRADSLNPGSFAYIHKVTSTSGKQQVIAKIKVMLKGESEANLYIELKRNGTVIKSFVSSASSEYPNKWQTISCTGEIENLKEGDELVFFTWGKASPAYFVDDFELYQFPIL